MVLPVLPPGENVLFVERVVGFLGRGGDRGCWASCLGRGLGPRAIITLLR